MTRKNKTLIRSIIYINNVRQEIQNTIENETDELIVEVLRKVKTLPADFEILKILNMISVQYEDMGSEYDQISAQLNIKKNIEVSSSDICISLVFLEQVNLIASVKQLSRKVYKITEKGRHCLIVNR